MNKYVAPVISALVIIALSVAYAIFLFLVLDEIDVVRAIRVMIAVGVGGVVVGISAALVSRIRELRGGQEDDLGKY